MVPDDFTRAKTIWMGWLVFFGLMGSGAADEEFTIGVMSFNIRTGMADDGPDGWELRKDLVAQVIREWAPDLVGSQETHAFQADYLGSALPEYAHFGMGRDSENQGERMEVFYRRDRFHPVETGHFWLSNAPDVPATRSWRSSLNRMVTWARFYDFESRGILYFLNTHFDHRSEEARQASAKLLAERVALLDPAFPVIVIGDFNAVAESSVAYKTLVGGRLEDAWIQAKDRAGPAGTGSSFRPEEREVIPRIDWILFGGPLQPETFTTIDWTVDGRYPSDHFPIAASFVWTIDDAMRERLRSGTR